MEPAKRKNHREDPPTGFPDAARLPVPTLRSPGGNAGKKEQIEEQIEEQINE